MSVRADIYSVDRNIHRWYQRPENSEGGGSQSVTGFCGIEDISKCLSPAERFAFTCEHQDVADKRIRYQGFNLEQTSKISPRWLIFSEREDYWERPPSEVDSVLCFSVILVLILLWNLMFDVCLHWKREKNEFQNGLLTSERWVKIKN